MSINWRKEDLPTGSSVTIRIADNTWYSRCRACNTEHIETGTHPYPRYMGIGKHEVSAHGLDVPGINVGLLP